MRAKIFLLTLMLILLNLASPLAATVQELQINGLVINGVTSQPLDKARVIVSLYFLNNANSFREDYYKAQLRTNPNGEFSLPLIPLKVYTDGLYHLSLIIAHGTCEDTVYSKNFTIEDIVGNALKLTFALNPVKTSIKLQGEVLDVITGEPLAHNQVNVYLAQYFKETNTWRNVDKITKDTGGSATYEIELPYQYSRTDFEELYRFALAVFHPEYGEVFTRDTYQVSAKSSPGQEYYDFTTLRFTTGMVWDKAQAEATVYLNDRHGLPIEEQKFEVNAYSGDPLKANFSPEITLTPMTDMTGKTKFTLPAKYLYRKDRFIEITGNDAVENFSQRFTNIFNQTSYVKLVTVDLSQKIHLEMLTRATNNLLFPWLEGSWWEVNYQNIQIKDQRLLFKVIAVEQIKKNKYFQVRVTPADHQEEVIYRLYYNVNNYALEYAEKGEGSENMTFSGESPVVFFDNYPCDFPLLDKIFTSSRYLTDAAANFPDLKPVEIEKTFRERTLIQTTKVETGGKIPTLSTVLDLTLEKDVYLTTFAWEAGKPWWTKYNKQWLKDEEIIDLCHAELTSFGFGAHTYYEKQ